MSVGHTVTVRTDHGNAVRTTKKHWAECETCSWLGPLRENWDDAQKDQDRHIILTRKKAQAQAQGSK